MSTRLSTGLGIVLFLVLVPMAFASADTTSLSPSNCDQLFNLPQGTITTTASAQYLNSQTCSAYQYLIARYNPGPCSMVGFSNAKVQGITSLNTTFAQNLANMLQAASAAGFNITINSAFRTVQGEQCANPGGFSGNSAASMHTKGLAADLQYPNDANSAGGCDSGQTSAAYNWVAANAKNYGLGLYDQLHSPVKGECNHVEAGAPVPGGIGPGGGGTSVPQPYTSGVIGATQNPLLPSQPSILSSNPFSTTPIAAAPLAAQAAQTCAPQYFCSASTLYYESSACVTQIFQACQYGCSGTACTPAPAQSASSSLQSASNPILTATAIATSAVLSLNTALSQSVQETSGPQNTSVITTIATGTGQYGPEIGQSTFSSQDTTVVNPQPALSPLQQLLANVRAVLVAIFNYLNPSAAQPAAQTSQ